MLEVVRNWGSTAGERGERLPCDDLLPGAEVRVHRAIDVDAPASTVFRWLCQLRVAPYSYDMLDNFGRRSPPELTPGLDQLEAGQRVMTIFELVEFEPGKSLTIRSAGRVFGAVAVTYRVTSREPAGSRILVRVLCRPPRSPLRPLLAALLPPGDLLMMRRQLLNLKRLSESDARL